jgi:TPP-dependent pyruvate/acetoin dehydrogenase alpha subunit
MTTKTHPPREQLREFLAEMFLIRRFEEKVEESFRAGDLAGRDPNPSDTLKYVYTEQR